MKDLGFSKYGRRQGSGKIYYLGKDGKDVLTKLLRQYRLERIAKKFENGKL